MRRRRAQSDERRRRVLNDDSSAGTESAAARGKSKARKATGSKSHYCKDALSKQVRISDLVPRRAWVHPLLFLLAASLLAGLVVLHHWQQKQLRTDLAIFDITATGSLARWFAAALLFAVAGVSLIAFSLRRQRESDYHTRYRVWLWIAMACVLMSAAVTTSWHQTAARVLDNATAWSPPGGTAMLWLIPAVVGYAILAIRLLLEVRGCRITSLAVVVASIVYSTVIISTLGVDVRMSEATSTMVIYGCQLSGHLVLLCGFLWYARYVVLDIQGLVPVREKKAKVPRESRKARRSKTESSAGDGGHQRIDGSHANTPAPAGRTDLEPDMTPTRRAARLASEAELDEDLYEDEPRRSKIKRNRKRQQQPATADYDEYEDSAQHGQRKLSKAERKRLRKQKARQRDAA